MINIFFFFLKLALAIFFFFFIYCCSDRASVWLGFTRLGMFLDLDHIFLLVHFPIEATHLEFPY